MNHELKLQEITTAVLRPEGDLVAPNYPRCGTNCGRWWRRESSI